MCFRMPGTSYDVHTHIGVDADAELVLATADGVLTRAIAPTR